MAYRAMRNQLIYDYRMSSRWLQNRLALENDSIMAHFYKFDIDKNIIKPGGKENWGIMDQVLQLIGLT